MADSETPYQQVWQIEKRNDSRHAGLRGKRSAGMLIEWKRPSRHPSCSSTQPVCIFERQRCLWQLHKASRHICCSCSDIATLFTEWHWTSRHICCIDNVTKSCLIKFHIVSWHVWWRVIGRVAFFIDFQWTRRHVWLNGTNTIRRHICWRLNSSHVLPPGHQTSLQSITRVYLCGTEPAHISVNETQGQQSFVLITSPKQYCTLWLLQLTGMLDTVALEQQARLFKLHPASVHICSICTRPAAQASLPQGQQTYLPLCMFDYVAQGQHICNQAVCFCNSFARLSGILQYPRFKLCS